MNPPGERLLGTRDLARRIPRKGGRPITEQAIRRWRTLGRGPKFLKIGGSCYYAESDVSAWFESLKAGSTAELKARRREAEQVPEPAPETRT